MFWPGEGGGQKPLAISVFGRPVLRPFSIAAPLWPKRIVFGQAERILLLRDLKGRLTCTGPLQGLPVVPGHPGRRIPGQVGGVVLQFGEVMEGIGLVQFTSMVQAHIEAAHAGAGCSNEFTSANGEHRSVGGSPQAEVFPLLTQLQMTPCFLSYRGHSTVRLTVVIWVTVVGVPFVIAVVPLKAPWIVIT